VINNQTIEQVLNFNCLGCDLFYNRDEDLQNKLFKFQHIREVIKRIITKKTRKDTQLQFYKVMVAPILLYGSEKWALNTTDKSRTETTEIKCLRKVADHTLRDEISNLTK
jgi:hypothetical protein